MLTTRSPAREGSKSALGASHLSRLTPGISGTLKSPPSSQPVRLTAGLVSSSVGVLHAPTGASFSSTLEQVLGRVALPVGGDSDGSSLNYPTQSLLDHP